MDYEFEYYEYTEEECEFDGMIQTEEGVFYI